MDTATATLPEPLPTTVLPTTIPPPDQDAPSATQRTGNGIVVNGLTARRHIGIAFNPSTASVGGRRNAKQISSKQAQEFADTCHQMLRRMRKQLGITATDATAFDSIHVARNGQQANGSGNGKAGCESNSPDAVPTDAPPITRDDAQIVGLITRGWDTALERLRVLKGVPDPGCRRPGEPIPKARKPTNRAPDSLACGLDTPTGSVPPK